MMQAKKSKLFSNDHRPGWYLREVEKVRLDAINEYISIQAAKYIYGVVIIHETFEVDEEATQALREKLKA